jgi:hypothetical protein
MRTFKKVIKTVGFAFLGMLIGFLIKGGINGFVDHMDKAHNVEIAIKENCDCEKVNQFMYARGIQFNAKDGITTEKAEFELVNCQYDNLEEEVSRLNAHLQDAVYGYADLDLLTLEFVGAEQHHTITIKNGIIQ